MSTVITSYNSPLGPLLLAADAIGLTHVSFNGQKYFPDHLAAATPAPIHPILRETTHWLDAYFSGTVPGQLPPLHAQGTPFQKAVWALLMAIPYGTTTTYGALAQALARQQGRATMSAQAVGGAVGRNPIAILVPCHRVIGANGSLTGYAGGLDKKRALLTLEGVPLPPH